MSQPPTAQEGVDVPSQLPSVTAATAAPPAAPPASQVELAASAAAAQPPVAAPTASSPPLAHALSNLAVNAPPRQGTSSPHLQPSSKRRRSSAGFSVPVEAPTSASRGGVEAHRRTPSGKVLDDGVGSPLLDSSLAGFANESNTGLAGVRRTASMSNRNGGEIGKGKEKEKELDERRLSPIQTGGSTSRSSPSLSISLPSFPVLPPSQPTPHQTYQTPSQVSSILSLPAPLLLQLARADSPAEQRAIAEREGAKSYLSSMSIPPPSPTTMVDNIQRAGLGMTSVSSSSAPSSSSSTPAIHLPASSSASAHLLPQLSLPSLPSLMAANAAGGHPAIPLLLGQGFSPPTPGVLAPIPGIAGVGEAVRLAAGEAESASGPFEPKYASVEDWSYKAAQERVEHPPSPSSAATHPSAFPNSTTSTRARPTLSTSHSFNNREITALAMQMKDWALAEQEKQVEQHVVEAKSAAVILAAQAAAGEGEDGEATLDLGEHREAYKQQLDQLASGYFAQLHRDALERLVEEQKELDGPPPPTSPSSAPPTALPLNSSDTAVTTSAAAVKAREQKEEQSSVMHVRASAAAAVAAQVMAAKDIARSAGERLVKLGADPRKVVEEVREVVEAEGKVGGSRRGSAAEIPEADKMALEDVGKLPIPSTAGPSKPALPSQASAALVHLSSSSTQPSTATEAELAALPTASAPTSLSQPNVPAPPALVDPSRASLSRPETLASVASSPAKRDYLLSYAHALYAKEPQSEELLPLLHTIESMHPDHLPTLLLISCVYYTSGELESSLYYNKKLLEYDPSYVEAMSNIGTTLRAMGRWHEAEKWWWKAIKLRPTYWDATENLLGVLCNPTPHAPPVSAVADGVPHNQPRYPEALALCEYVESQIFAMPASAAFPAVPTSSFLDPLQTLPRPRPLPSTIPYNHVHRLQNLFYASGNLRLALQDARGAQDEYEKAIEVALALPDWAQHVPGLQYPSFARGCTTRDLVVVTTVIGRILAAYAQGGGGPEGTALIARTAEQLGVVDERGSVPFERIFRVVKQGGDAYVSKLLQLGGGVLPTVLLEPHHLAQLPGLLFPEARGSLPALFDPAFVTPAGIAANGSAAAPDPQRKQVELSAKQTTSTMLLTLAKILQDSLAPTSTTRCSIGGIPASQSLLLPLYYVALALYPSPSTCNNLGILLSTLTATAVVASSDPNKPPTLLTGQVLAMKYYQTGLKLDNRHPHLYTNLGSLLKDMGRLLEAVDMYKEAVRFNPTFDVALANLANAVKDTGNIQDSIPYYRQAVKLNPQFPEAVCGLVNALSGVCDWQGRGGVGEEWLVDQNKQLVHCPAQGDQPRRRAGYMQQISDLVAKQLKDGLSYGVGSLGACGNLNDWLVVIAQALYDTTPQKANPEQMNLWAARLRFLLGDFDRKQHGVVEGGYLIRLVERLIRRIQRRWYLTEYGNIASLPKESAPTSRIIPTQQDLVKYCRPPLPQTLPPIPVPTVLPFHCFTLPVTARETRLISHRTGLRISHSTLNQPWMPPIVYPPPRPPIDGKINIGYVSSDLGNHPLSHLMQSVFGYHSSSEFNVFVYATSPSDKSPYRLKIERESQNFVDCSQESTQQIVDRIVKDEIHILVNLSGYTKGARNEVFAARPAPVQMSYMGFASTLSAGFCDYFIVDPIVCPPQLVSGNQWRYWGGHSQPVERVRPPKATDFEGDLDPEGESELFVYTEKLIYLPHSYFVTDHKQAWREDESVGVVKPGEAAVTSTLPPSDDVTWALEEDKRLSMRRAMFPNIRDDTFIMANWNQLYKIDPFVFRIWLNILKKHPNSILWLLRFPAPGEAHLKDTAIRWAGEEVASRIIFTDVANKNEHIHRGRIADLFLDTTECNAHTTAADILWSGTPILTFPRHAHKMASRVAASIAVATGYGPQMIVSSEDEYEKRVLELARGLVYENVAADPSQPPTVLEGREQRRGKGELAELRKALFMSRESSPLFDTRRWVRGLEKGYAEAWRRYVSGAEFEDLSNWDRSSANIWVEDDVDGTNLQRQTWF